MGRFLVFVQLTCILIIGVRTPLINSTPITIFIQIVGLLLGVWAVYVLRYGLSIFPDVVGDVLVTAGPYNVIRHPMYTSVLLVSGAWLVINFDLINILTWVLLLVVLFTKIDIEEKLLTKKFPEYKAYKERTWKLLPFIY